ncbi:MAG: 4'-phosphopantetheinyl transferase superfamily protein [Deltaproteobacteria bacterium]|nr:4'-phosphopantetheinyl transferase superfamily protein [Deltaproteobacteria bacterium]
MENRSSALCALSPPTALTLLPSDPACAGPFQTAFWLTLPHGVAVGIALPEHPGAGGQAVPESVLARLLPEERAIARTLRGHRVLRWVGGRLALHEALRHLWADPVPLLPLPGGGVEGPPGFTVSVSHKRTLAVGMAARSAGGTLGVDLEDVMPTRLHVAPVVLRPEEIDLVRHLSPERRWLSMLVRFSIKEALYKALFPHLSRFVGFQEAFVVLAPNGSARVQLSLEGQEGPFRVEARYHWLPGRVLSSVRVWPEASRSTQQSPAGAASGLPDDAGGTAQGNGSLARGGPLSYTDAPPHPEHLHG